MSRGQFLHVVRNSWKTAYCRTIERRLVGIVQKNGLYVQRKVLSVPRNGCQCVAIKDAEFYAKNSMFSDKADSEKSLEDVKKDMDEAKKEDEFHPRATGPRWIDKKVLVWMGKYPSEDAIPTLVSDVVINSARDKFRVYVSSSMIVLGLLGALITMFYGRWSSKKRDNIYERTKKNPHPTSR